MGMKEPKGRALKIGGTVSSPVDVDQYTQGVGNTISKAKNVGTEQGVGNSSMPPTKYSGDNSADKKTEGTY